MTIKNICRFCKHWDFGNVSNLEFRAETTYTLGCHKLKKVLDIEIDQGGGWDAGGASVETINTPGDFGCNKFESLTET